jgi:hypothetical protein
MAYSFAELRSKATDDLIQEHDRDSSGETGAEPDERGVDDSGDP